MAANIQFVDYAAGRTLGALGTGTTSIQLAGGQGALFPAAGGGLYFYATLVDIETGGFNQHEVVRVTNKVGDLLTVVRGSGIIDGVPQAWPAGSGVECRDCAQALTDLAAGGGGGGAPTSSPYVLVSPDASLPNRRILTGSGTINVTDGGPTNPIVLSIPVNGVDNTRLAQMPANTIKGNNTAGLANAADLTAAQVATLIGAISGVGVVSISAGLIASRPAPGVAGRVWLATDDGSISRDTGAAWFVLEPALTGDVTSVAGLTATTIAGHAVTNPKMAQVPGATFKGNPIGSTADVQDMAGAVAVNLLPVFGPSGAPSKGIVPAPGAVAGIRQFLREDSTWAIPSSWWFNVKDYGAVGDGVADDTAAINAAFTAMPPGGAVLYFPYGTYKVTATLTPWNKAMTVFGDGWNSSTIATNSPTLDVVTLTGIVHVSGLRFQPSVPRTNGKELALSGGFQHVIDNCLFQGAFCGISVTGAVGQVVIDTCSFRSGTAATGVMIDFNTTGAANVISNILMDAAAGSMPLAGIRCLSTQDLAILNCEIIHQGNDLMIVPTSGQVVASVYVTNSFFDTAVCGCLIQPTGSGAVVRCNFTGNWFSSHTTQGIRVIGGGSTIVDGIDFTATQCYFNGSNGVQVDAGCKNIRFLGGEFAQNTGDGLQFNNTDFSVIGVKSGAAAQGTANTGYGVNVNNAACDRFTVTGNDLIGNSLGALNNASTQINWLTGQNLGDTGKFTVRGNILSADYSNAVVNARTVWQSSVGNGFTAIGVKPNGTATLATMQFYNGSDLTVPVGFVDIRAGATAHQITSGQLNGAATVPLNFVCNGINAQLTITGRWLFGAPIPADDGASAVQINGAVNIQTGASPFRADFSTAVPNRTYFQTNQVNQNTTMTAVPNGAAGTASWQIFNNSNLAAPLSYGDIRIGAAAVQLFSGQLNGGPILPIRIVGNASTQTEWNTSGDLQYKFSIADQGYSLQAPVTGFTITIPDHCSGLMLNPAGVLATGTITMPANPVDGQLVRLATTQTITALTLNANAGQTISGNVTTLSATAPASYMYILGLLKWLKVGS